MRFAAVVRI